MIINYEDLTIIRNNNKDKKIVMLKGSFDLFHIGHLNMLKKAKELGDILVVVIKCNKAIKVKGANRPIIKEEDRAKIVDSIKYTDYVIVANREFDIKDDNNLEEKDSMQYRRYAKIIMELKPDILAKPKEHKIQQSLLELYKENATQIVEIQYTKGISTTEIIKKIRG